MKQNKNKTNFFLKKNPSFWFFFTPLIIIVILSIGVIIATSWYSIDYRIAEEFAKGLKVEFGKYWSRFYEQLGVTELFTIIFIYIAVLLETWFLTKIAQKNQKFKKNYWVVDSYYIIILIAWVGAHTGIILKILNTDNGFGKGVDKDFLTDLHYQLTGAVLAFIMQTTILALGFYYVRYHLVKRNRILVEQFWIKAVKSLSFLAITYIVIVILKGTTNRLYYYNAIFGDILNEHPDLIDAYKNSGAQYGYGSDYTGNIPRDLQYPWWKSSLGLAKSDPFFPSLGLPVAYAFPSGHVNATYVTGSGILLFLKNRNNEKVSWKVKLLFVVWLVHVLSMNFALVVVRFHWISDTAFTFIFSTLMVLVVNFTVNKICAKKLNSK